MLARIASAAALGAILAFPAAAQQPVSADSLARRMQDLQRQLDSLKSVADRHDTRLMELDERGVAMIPAGAGAEQDTARRRLQSGQGIYGKPFVRRFGSGTAIGGYVDVEYINELDAHTSKFDQHRLIPFLFAEITDQLHFGAEIEFEHGAEIVKVEFATLDYSISEAFNVRGGIILSPLGRFNLVHDSPVNDLTDRPLVNRQIIPTTLSESGAGFFGALYPTAQSLLTYEAYVVNGFTGNVLTFDTTGTVSAVRVRSGRGSAGGDVNFGKSLVGRLAFSPMLGVEIGASAHTGRYSGNGNRAFRFKQLRGGVLVDTTVTVTFTGDDRLTIMALDGSVTRGAFELLGEYARTSVELPAGALGSRVADSQDGFYVQGNYHFGHGWVPPTQSSVFTGVVRFDRVDWQRGVDGDLQERFTLGLNWRPVEDAVIKTDFQWNWTTPAGSTDRGNLSRRLLVSLASYF